MYPPIHCEEPVKSEADRDRLFYMLTTWNTSPTLDMTTSSMDDRKPQHIISILKISDPRAKPLSVVFNSKQDYQLE
jgi:hypothetical protein